MDTYLKKKQDSVIALNYPFLDNFNGYLLVA